MSDKKKNLKWMVLFLVGLSILLYPTVSNLWNEHRNQLLLTKYEQALPKLKDETKTTLLEAARAYNATLVDSVIPDAFSIRDGISDPAYEALLNPNGDGIMGSVEIPAIGIKLPIYHYTTDASLNQGVGHLFGSALPVGGKGSHAVFSAHRGLPGAKLFTDLPLLKQGDVFYFHILDEHIAYEVDQLLTVLPHEVESLSVAPGQDYATLVTCTPYAVNSHRLLVRGHRIPYVENEYEAVTSQRARVDVVQLWAQLACAGAGVLLAAVFMLIYRRWDRKRSEKR